MPSENAGIRVPVAVVTAMIIKHKPAHQAVNIAQRLFEQVDFYVVVIW